MCVWLETPVIKSRKWWLTYRKHHFKVRFLSPYVLLSSVLQCFICGLYACTEDRCVGGRPSLCNFSALYQPRDERLESPIMCFMCILCCLEKHLLYITGNMLCVLYKWYLFHIKSGSVCTLRQEIKAFACAFLQEVWRHSLKIPN